MKLARSLHRKATASAISCGCPALPTGLGANPACGLVATAITITRPHPFAVSMPALFIRMSSAVFATASAPSAASIWRRASRCHCYYPLPEHACL